MNIYAKSVYNHADSFIFDQQTYGCFLSAKHRKNRFCIVRQIETLKGIAAVTLFLCLVDVFHLVHAVMLDDARVAVIGDQVIILVFPAERPRRNDIGRAVFAGGLVVTLRTVEIYLPAEIGKRDPAVGGYRVTWRCSSLPSCSLTRCSSLAISSMLFFGVMNLEL